MEGPDAASRKKKKKKKKKSRLVEHTGSNVVALPACYLASSAHPPSWVLGCGPFRRRDFGLGPRDAVPDLSIDPDSGVLSVFNASSGERSVFVSVLDDCEDVTGKLFAKGAFVDTQGREGRCATFIVTLQPSVVMELCRLHGPQLVSHVSDLTRHAHPDHFDARHVIDFPLAGDGPYLCSQAHGGCLTHFTASTHHAVDLDCPVGTPVVAVGSGVVTEVRQSNKCWGPYCENLFAWNSLMLRLDEGGLFVEFVHIKCDSVRVAVGQHVERGEVLCESGNVGFCPTPHLHIQCHMTDAADAHTIKFAFRKEGTNEHYFPESGKKYSKTGGRIE